MFCQCSNHVFEYCIYPIMNNVFLLSVLSLLIYPIWNYTNSVSKTWQRCLNLFEYTRVYGGLLWCDIRLFPTELIVWVLKVLQCQLSIKLKWYKIQSSKFTNSWASLTCISWWLTAAFIVIKSMHSDIGQTIWQWTQTTKNKKQKTKNKKHSSWRSAVQQAVRVRTCDKTSVMYYIFQ